MKNPCRARFLIGAIAGLAAAALSGASPSTPSLTTNASAAGASLSDIAHLTGGNHPTGQMTLTLFGPDDALCSSLPATTQQLPVNGNGDYGGDQAIVAAPGTYRWTASYSGDPLNNPVATGCNDLNETVVVTTGTPTLTTTATPTGRSIHDVAHLTGNNPTGTLTFFLYGPNDATCNSVTLTPEPLFVNGSGDYSSPGIDLLVPGTYRWIASYAGDAANNPVSTDCNDPNETSVVSIAPIPTLGQTGLILLAVLMGGAGWLLAKN